MRIMDAMRRNKMDLELAEALLTVLGLIVIAFVLLFGGVALVEWAMGAP